MPTSIGGLASGLDTAQIIEALMNGERIGRMRLEAKQGSVQRQLSVWQDLNTKLGAIATAAGAFAVGGTASGIVAASSAEDLVAVSSTSTATPSSFTFRVQQIAVAHQAMVSGFSSATTLVGAGRAVVSGGLAGLGATLTTSTGLAAGRYAFEVKSVSGATATVIFGGREQTVASTGSVTVDDGLGNSATLSATTLKVGKAAIGVAVTDSTTTLGQLAVKVNALNAGVSAAAIDLGNGSADPVDLVLSAAEAGTGNTFGVDFAGLGAFAGKPLTTLRAATDAQLLLADGVTTVTRGSNRITDVVLGATLDLLAADPTTDVRVTVAQDADRAVAAAKAVVDALTSVISTVKRNTSFNPATGTAATFTGDSRARRLSDQLSSVMAYTDTGQSTKVLSQIGVTLARTGTYTFDEAKFRRSLAEDNAGTMRLLAGDGAARAGAFAELKSSVEAMQAADGLVDGAIDAAQLNIASFDKRLTAFDRRLELIEKRIRKQYTSLETTMAQLKSQASGLSQALG